ncbi:hypothetical protein [Rhodoblastus sp.]|uniref:hypothetical protein n=1 Tax=Rhodoblastus sp. TaxID=1962975 RepID=UPI003F9D18B8
MYIIYCAFNSSLNQYAWEPDKQAHVIKIGATKGKKAREGWLNDGYPVTTRRLTAPLANRKGWKIVGDWPAPAKYEWPDIRKLEGDIRREFTERCGKLKLYSALRREMKKTDDHLNGLSEIVRADIARMDSVSFPLHGGSWRYDETPDLIAKIVHCVRVYDAEWRATAKISSSQTV